MSVGLLHHALERAGLEHGKRVALLDGDHVWTTLELASTADDFAGVLAARGVHRGDRVALLCSNRPEFLVAVCAASRCGAATVLVSPAWKQREVDHALDLTGPVLGVADGAGVGLLASRLGDAVIDLDEFWGTDRGRPEEGEPSDDAVLVFSSGTTGLPKAVRHSHTSMGHGVAHWVEALGLTADDRFQVATPPSHILGLLNLLTGIEAGASIRLHRRFDLDELLRRIESERITLEMAVAPIALAIADHPDLESYDLSSLRYLMWGATPVTPSVAERITARSGVGVLPAYGSSEVPVIAANPVDDRAAWRLDNAGRAPTGVTLRVTDLETGAVLPPGATGEVEVLSASAMSGYLPDSETAAAFHEGWYRTGDVGTLDADGWVQLTDRVKEMIKVNGFQVAPAEIEAVLHGHPGVRDCAVFGIPDPRSGERPVAAVALDPAAAVTPAELSSLVAGTLATYKHVKEVVVVDSIPRLPSGKVLRRELAAAWQEGH